MTWHSQLTSTDLHNPKGIQYAEDIATFDSGAWHNSGLRWNKNSMDWEAMPSSASYSKQFHYPADYILYRDNDTYFLKNCSDGQNIYSNTDASTVFNYATSSMGGRDIYVPSGQYNVSTSVYIRSHTTLRGAGKSSKINLKNDNPCFLFRNTYRSNLKDFYIDLPDEYESQVIKLEAYGETEGVAEANRWNIIENIYINDSHNYHSGTAVMLHASSASYGSDMWGNTMRHVYAYRIGTGIHLKTDENRWMNGNSFEHMYFNQCKTIVNFDVPNVNGLAGNGCNRNTFIDIKNQTTTWTKDGFKNICNNGNIFLDCLVWDWHVASNGNYEWSIHPSANKTVIIGSTDDSCTYYDSGAGTFIAFGGETLKLDGDIDLRGGDLDNVYNLTAKADYPINIYATSGGGIGDGFQVYTRNSNDDASLLRMQIANLGDRVNIIFISSNIRLLGGGPGGTQYASINQSHSLGMYNQLRNQDWQWNWGLNYSETFGIYCSSVANGTRPFAIDKNLPPTNTIYIKSGSGDGGRVGINDGSPSYNLDVTGDARLTEGLYSDYISSQTISGGTITSDGITTNWISSNAGNIKQTYMYPIWAEENAELNADTYEWAYGNGANTPSDCGIPIFVESGWSCTVVAMSLSLNGTNPSANVQLILNGAEQGTSCDVGISGAIHGQQRVQSDFTPISVSNEDFINFKTVTANGTAGPCQVTAWLRMTKN